MWQHKIAIIVLVCACSQLTLARPGYLHTAAVLPAYEHFEYAPAVVGHTLHSIPTAISHQSQTIVHEKRPYLRPIYEHTPLLNSYHAAPVTTVALPLSYSSAAYGSALYGNHGWDHRLSTIYGAGWADE